MEEQECKQCVIVCVVSDIHAVLVLYLITVNSSTVKMRCVPVSPHDIRP